MHLVCSIACGCVTQRWQASAEAERQRWEEELKVSFTRSLVGVVKVSQSRLRRSAKHRSRLNSPPEKRQRHVENFGAIGRVLHRLRQSWASSWRGKGKRSNCFQRVSSVLDLLPGKVSKAQGELKKQAEELARLEKAPVPFSRSVLRSLGFNFPGPSRRRGSPRGAGTRRWLRGPSAAGANTLPALLWSLNKSSSSGDMSGRARGAKGIAFGAAKQVLGARALARSQRKRLERALQTARSRN